MRPLGFALDDDKRIAVLTLKLSLWPFLMPTGSFFVKKGNYSCRVGSENVLVCFLSVSTARPLTWTKTSSNLPYQYHKVLNVLIYKCDC